MHPPLPEQPHPAGQRPDPLAEAARAAIEAGHNSQQLALVTAVLQAQQIAQAAQPPVCTHHGQQRPERPWGKYAVIGILACTLGTLFVIGLAVLALAVAILGIVALVGLIIVRSMWRDYQRKKDG